MRSMANSYDNRAIVRIFALLDVVFHIGADSFWSEELLSVRLELERGLEQAPPYYTSLSR